MGQDVGQGFAIERGVDGYRYIARHENGQVGQYPVRTVLANDGHAAALGPSLGFKPMGDAPGLVGRLGPGDVLHLARAHGLGQENLVATLTLPTVQALQGQVGWQNGHGLGH